MKIIGMIPARGGSQGVKNKNIKKLAGHPLISYTINAGKKSKLVDLYCTSDSKVINKIAETYGCKSIDRPSNLATNTCPMLEG